MQSKTLALIAGLSILSGCGGGGNSDTASAPETPDRPATPPETATINSLSADGDKANVVADIGDLWTFDIDENTVSLEVIDSVYEVTTNQTFNIDNVDSLTDRKVYDLSQTYTDVNGVDQTASSQLNVYEDGRWSFSGQVTRDESSNGKSVIATTAQGSGSIAGDLSDLVGVYNTIDAAFKADSGLAFKDYDPKKVVIADDKPRKGFFFPTQSKFLLDTEFAIQPAVKQLLCFDGDIRPEATSTENACQSEQREAANEQTKLFASKDNPGVIDLFFDGITKEGQTDARLVLSSFGSELTSFSADEVGLNDSCIPSENNGSEDAICQTRIGKRYYVRANEIDNNIFPQGAKYSCAATGLNYGQVTVTNSSEILFTPNTDMSAGLKGTLFGEFAGDDGSRKEEVNNTDKKGRYSITFNQVPNGDYETSNNGRFKLSTDVIDRTGGATFTKIFTPEPGDQPDSYNEETRLYVLPVNDQLFYMQSPADIDRIDSELGLTVEVDSQTTLVCERQL